MIEAPGSQGITTETWLDQIGTASAKPMMWILPSTACLTVHERFSHLHLENDARYDGLEEILNFSLMSLALCREGGTCGSVSHAHMYVDRPLS